MLPETETKLTGFKEFVARLTSDQDFKPSRQKVLNALATLLNAAEFHRAKTVSRIPSTARVPGRLSELEKTSAFRS